MKFNIQKKENPNIKRYEKKDIETAYKFSAAIYREMGSYLRAIILFGSTARRDKTSGDIDLLLILDDLSFELSQEFIQTYRIIVEKLVEKISKKIHITTLKYTAFWEYVRNGDPVAVNILRDGYPIIDTGFFEPLQALLYQGRIRPSAESIWTYYSRAPNTLNNSKWHISQGCLDLYWAVIDSAHAALMSIGEVPPTPSHVADMIEEKMVKTRLIEKKYSLTANKFYQLSRKILHREIKEVSGEEFDKLFLEAKDFVDRMRKFIEKK
jgi:uncharacterized protein (UPF0332 family)/predicted nucleotidyltransferase